jgi:biotin carboxyl carrier protein
MQFQATVGDLTVDLQLDGDSALVDGTRAGVRVHRLGPHTFHLLVEGRSHVLTLTREDAQTVRVTTGGRSTTVQLKDERALLLERLGITEGAGAGVRELRAPMPGLVLQVLAEPGQAVEAGSGLVVLEAMKMENELRAEAAGTVSGVHVSAGDAVSKGDLLVSFET